MFIFPVNNPDSCTISYLENETDPLHLSFTLISISFPSSDSESPQITSKKTFHKTFAQTPSFKITYDAKTCISAVGHTLIYESLAQEFAPVTFSLPSAITAFDVSPNCAYLVAKDAGNILTLFNLRLGTRILLLPNIATYFLDASSSTLFTISTAGAVTLYALQTGQALGPCLQSEETQTTASTTCPFRLIGLHASNKNTYLAAHTIDPIANTSSIVLWKLAS